MKDVIQEVPPNKFGIFAAISEGGFKPEELWVIISGPVAATEPALQAELAKPLILDETVL